MAIITRLVYQYGGQGYEVHDDTAIGEFGVRTGYVDLSSTASSEDNAQRLAQAQLDRSKFAVAPVSGTLAIRGGDEPVLDFNVFGIANGPTQAENETADYDIQAINFGTDDVGHPLIGIEVGDRRISRAELLTAQLDRAARGTLNGQNKVATSSLVPDEFDDFATGKVSPITGPDFSKPDDINVGSSGLWYGQSRCRLTSVVCSSDLSGVDDTIFEIKKNGDSLVPPQIGTLAAGAVYVQFILYDVLVNLGESVQVEVTQAGGHTQVHIQVDAAPAI